MGKITLYRFSFYDIRSDAVVFSKRWGTSEAVAKLGGQIVESSACEADETSILTDVVGLTEIGFTPPSLSVVRSARVGVEAEGALL